MLAQWIIEKKRDGLDLSKKEIDFFITGYTRGAIPDYQMSALAMAIYFKGMTPDEVSDLTDCMMRSGKVMNLSSIRKPLVDKHSTGGIGDKVSLVLAPLVASCGVSVPMIAGRGLGITGGTIDKLESIPGYRTNLSPKQFTSVLKKCGCSIIAQTPDLAPADRKLYALRDVTATVPSIPLISASIMSKKLAEGADALMLDIKWGKGAFMKSRKDAMLLATTMIAIGRRMGKGMCAILTDMNQPLGRNIGNSVEVIESIETLKGAGPKDLRDLTIQLGMHMLVLGKVAGDLSAARKMLEKQLQSGAAFRKFKEMVKLHGGNTAVIDDTSKLPRSRIHGHYPAQTSGYIAGVDAELIGRACIVLGAGRHTTTDNIDHAAGITGLLKIGERIKKGAPLLTLHANNSDRIKEAKTILQNAVRTSNKRTRPPGLITQILL